MTLSLNANPGQTVLLVVETKNSDGERVDGYTPTLNFLRNPSGVNILTNTTMTNISTGLYQVSVTIPSGITAIGSYVGSASWIHPTTTLTQYEAYVINVQLAFGIASVTPA